ncbi:MAG: 6,7-dimethyl-8-ribityllumazine synthase [Candidatus Dadabacteria bacterium]|nr:MAG: 6,7-dimethyl-8-ribityllumazine synthase [Candidatus Dadabacteria bacterium]
MSKKVEGKLTAEGLKFGLVVSRFNSFVTDHLLSGAVDTILRHGGNEENIQIVYVPGSFEIPLASRAIASKVDAVIALGAVIRGATPHFDYVCKEVSAGVAKVSLEVGKPVIFGVITADTIEQAIERSGTKAGNKGSDAALAAIEMANLMAQLRCASDSDSVADSKVKKMAV